LVIKEQLFFKERGMEKKKKRREKKTPKELKEIL